MVSFAGVCRVRLRGEVWQRDRDLPLDVARDLVVGGRSSSLGECGPRKVVRPSPSMTIALGGEGAAAAVHDLQGDVSALGVHRLGHPWQPAACSSVPMPGTPTHPCAPWSG
ncbi:hypothetical protein GCM10010390_57230 [Streptomyces mordarskii]|uniref:Uncharacterized protein n=1 Tax=Streptomyces mordarskii TaxID=1226758 RepID=A0ABP3NP39_9ACTN